MIPLAVTSTAGWIRRMGGKRWAMLHRLIYLTAIAGVIHYYWLVKSDVHLPLEYAACDGDSVGLAGLRLLFQACRAACRPRFRLARNRLRSCRSSTGIRRGGPVGFLLSALSAIHRLLFAARRLKSLRYFCTMLQFAFFRVRAARMSPPGRILGRYLRRALVSSWRKRIPPPKRRSACAYWADRVLEEHANVGGALPAQPIHDLRISLRRCILIADVMRDIDPACDWKAMRKSARRTFQRLGTLARYAGPDGMDREAWHAGRGFDGCAAGGAEKKARTGPDRCARSRPGI